MFGLHDASVSLQEGDSYVILRYKDGKSDKFYGLLNRDGHIYTNWGRFKGSVHHSDGQQKSCTLRELLDLLNDKTRKGYKVMEIRRNISKMTLPRPEGLEDAMYLIPKELAYNNMLWGVYDQYYNFMFLVDAKSACELSLNWGVFLTGLNKF